MTKSSWRHHWIVAPATPQYNRDRDVKGKIIAMCEQMEEEADSMENEHFARGYRRAAKSLRNYAADCFEIAAQFPPD